jgi:hypothetical protein
MFVYYIEEIRVLNRKKAGETQQQITVLFGVVTEGRLPSLFKEGTSFQNA